jgi:cytochrome c-type biogenesis protein CcmH/NrfG
VIKDLQDALYRYPVDVNLWVALGDAYIHTENLKDALNTLSKAEDLVR